MTNMPLTSKNTRTERPLSLVCQKLVAELRERDTDPEYADAPVLDVYGRISKNPETGETEKVDRQLEDCLRDLMRRKARLGKVLRDDGLSAWKLTAKRPDWDELVGRLGAKEVRGVIAWHTDRLMRQPRDLEQLITFGDAGLLVGSCHGDYDLASADDRFTLRVLTAAAAKDSDNTSRRQKRKAQAKRDRGEKTGGPRGFGEPGTYRRVKVSDEDLAVEREAIRWAVRGHLARRLSVRDITRQWNAGYESEDGTVVPLRTVGGKEWDPRYVNQVLLSPRIAGLIERDGKIVGRRTDVEPIITEDEFRALRATFASRKRGRPVSDHYLLTGGFLICDACGRPMTGRAGKVHGKHVRRYMCRDRNGGCGKVGIVADALEALVVERAAQRLSHPDYARRIKRNNDALERAEVKLEAAEETRRKLAAKLGSDGMTFDVWEAADGPLKARIEALRAEVEALSSVEAQAVAVAASVEEIRRLLTGSEETMEAKRRIVRSAFPRGLRILARGKGSNQYVDIGVRIDEVEEARAA
jgi:site-specific DNA recombinase